MRRLVIFTAIAFALASPACAATSSADLDTFAKTLEQSQPSATLNSKLLTLLREPAQTIEGRTLPTSAAQYTTSVETALKLSPANMLYGVRQVVAPSRMCTAMLTYPNNGYVQIEAFAWGSGTCAAVMSAAIARAWAFKLRAIGR
jgi:hypothetical protein